MLNIGAVDNGNLTFSLLGRLLLNGFDAGRSARMTNFKLKRVAFSRSPSPMGRAWGGGFIVVLLLCLSTTLPAQTWTTTPWPAN